MLTSYEKILKEAQNSEQTQYLSKQIAELIDLTLLNENASEEEHLVLCEKANENQVPAVCVYSDWVLFCKKQLNKNIKIATVANFPKANLESLALQDELNKILELQPDEIDIVFPYEDYLQGETKKAFNKMLFCRDLVPENIKLKIILETGAFENLKDIESISRELIDLSVDFLKTSTGKAFTGADPLKSIVMLKIIADHASRKLIGFKASGGVRTIQQASLFMNIAKIMIDKSYLNSDTFRIGASQLIEN